MILSRSDIDLQKQSPNTHWQARNCNWLPCAVRLRPRYVIIWDFNLGSDRFWVGTPVYDESDDEFLAHEWGFALNAGAPFCNCASLRWYQRAAFFSFCKLVSYFVDQFINNFQSWSWRTEMTQSWKITQNNIPLLPIPSLWWLTYLRLWPSISELVFWQWQTHLKNAHKSTKTNKRSASPVLCIEYI